MFRKEMCPQCRQINKDGWAICSLCGAKAPLQMAGSNRTGPNVHTLVFSGPELYHLLFCLHQAVVYNKVRSNENPDVFWRRHLVLKGKLQKAARGAENV